MANNPIHHQNQNYPTQCHKIVTIVTITALFDVTLLVRAFGILKFLTNALILALKLLSFFAGPMDLTCPFAVRKPGETITMWGRW